MRSLTNTWIGRNDRHYQVGGEPYHADEVLHDARLVGISSGRAMSQYYLKRISLCSIDVDYATLGAEVTVLWGNSGPSKKRSEPKWRVSPISTTTETRMWT